MLYKLSVSCNIKIIQYSYQWNIFVTAMLHDKVSLFYLSSKKQIELQLQDSLQAPSKAGKDMKSPSSYCKWDLQTVNTICNMKFSKEPHQMRMMKKS